MLIECVPNVSEGRDANKIEELGRRVSSVPDVKLLHVDSSFDANRTVFTFVGPPAAVLEAGFCLVAACLELIDMQKQAGAHPRLGACDVFPFVPLSGASMEDCIRLSEELSKRVGEQLRVPVFLYARSARTAARENLADVRRGQYEKLQERFLRGERADFGPSTFVPEFGALICGARDFLLAYNVNLSTADIEVAKRIALRIRESNLSSPDRLLSCRAIGWLMPELGLAQVSTNLYDFKQTGLFETFSKVQLLARAEGVEVCGSELVGLTPKAALIDAAKKFLASSKQVALVEEEVLMALACQHLGLLKFDYKMRVLEKLLAI